MPKLIKCLIIFVLLMVSCSLPIRIPRMAPAVTQNVVLEAFRLVDGKIFIVKSEIITGQYYWEGATATPKRKRVWMEIYAAVNGRIVLVGAIEARCVPAKPEEWEWDIDAKKETN